MNAAHASIHQCSNIIINPWHFNRIKYSHIDSIMQVIQFTMRASLTHSAYHHIRRLSTSEIQLIA